MVLNLELFIILLIIKIESEYCRGSTKKGFMHAYQLSSLENKNRIEIKAIEDENVFLTNSYERVIVRTKILKYR